MVAPKTKRGPKSKTVRIDHDRSAKRRSKPDSRPLDTQVGGSHYKGLTIQPVTYAMANNLGFMEGSVVKYVTRWPEKGGIQDLEKAKHFIEMLIEFHSGKMDLATFTKGVEEAMRFLEAA